MALKKTTINAGIFSGAARQATQTQTADVDQDYDCDPSHNSGTNTQAQTTPADTPVARRSIAVSEN